MLRAQDGDRVMVHFVGQLEQGNTFASEEDKPLPVVLGSGQMMPAFEEALVGMAKDEDKEFTLTPEQGFGQRDENLLIQVPRKEIGPDIPLEVGMALEVRDQKGNQQVYTVAQLDDDFAALDGNHPLAGHTITFRVTVLDIQRPDDEA